ncbi:MAG: DUF1189 domain-containing protein [Clostridia bacterium]|nr:DUF1189 domain-containing protein [Clostridia bacterium]
MSKDEKKLSFFRKISKSINDFDRYEDFALEKTSDAIKYALKLILIFTVVVCIGFTYICVQEFDAMFAYIKNELPYFKFENNELKIDINEAKIIKNEDEDISSVFIIDTIDTNIETDKYNEEISSYNIGVILLKDKIIIKTPQTSSSTQYNFSEIAQNYNLGTFDKTNLITKVESINIVLKYAVIFIILFVYFYPIYLIALLLDAVILSILGSIVALFYRMKIKFAPRFNIGIHALTLSVMLNMIYILVNLFIGFEIKYFDWMYNVISYIYVVVAILIIKSDLINRKMELIKLEQEKEKIKIELEKQKDEKDKDEDEKTKEDKEKKENNNLEDSPEGSNA